MPRELQESEHAMQHWTLTRDADGLARLTLDRAGGSTNTLGAPVFAELNAALDELDRNPPRGLIIASGKANGFIAGADVDEFSQLANEAGALALVKRGWDAFERLAAVKYPTVALGHPVGASGARIVLHVLNVLRRTGGRRGMAAICIGGGLGGAMLIERV